MGKKSKNKAKASKKKEKGSGANQVPVDDTARDPKIPSLLTPQEEADLPPLLSADESPFVPVKNTNASMDFSELARQLGASAIEVNECVACNEKKPKSDFTTNQWDMKNQEVSFGPRCRSCVAKGKFRIVDPDRIWVGWPKDPLQVLWERGWIDSPRGQRINEERYPPERIGKMVLGMPDVKLLLKNFETAGHYGYGGVNEELCCMPGCRKGTDLQACGRCKYARYCCKEHQALHYPHHKDDCTSWSPLPNEESKPANEEEGSKPKEDSKEQDENE